ncbi:GTP cyclohydrolase II [Niveibacterium sp. SC-1]|uniref:GTP cyclohydrolase II n=1 Tax=Niveibacterium sp. SC-1 TaxID=3135646 RepID=UPI00311F773C
MDDKQEQEIKACVECVAKSVLPTRHGDFVTYAFRDRKGIEHLALTKGDLSGAAPLARLHSECLTGDALGSQRCDCGEQLDMALQRIDEEGRGVLVYLRGHEGRGIGLAHKIRAYALQDKGLDTVDANLELGLPVDDRDYSPGIAILKRLGVTAVRLMSNNPLKVQALEAAGIKVEKREPHLPAVHATNARYLRTKRDRMGHLLANPALGKSEG